MSFTIKLQNNDSEPYRINKNLTDVEEEQATLKASCSITNPVFLLSLPNLPTFNYVTVEQFERSYFVQEIISVNNNIWEVRCAVDVLQSFKEEILNNTAIIKRQENDWNLFYNDSSFRCYQNPHIVLKEFPNGFTPDSSSYILAVAGGVEEVTE